jgi:hypothetical protein
VRLAYVVTVTRLVLRRSFISCEMRMDRVEQGLLFGQGQFGTRRVKMGLG